jgi:integrase
MTAGAIKQSAIDLYPGCSGATWNRQVITPTQAVINHCAELELCSFIRIKRFDFEEKVKTPVDQEWLDTFVLYARPMIKALLLVMYATGCRFCEAHRLSWKTDIDMKRRTIKIRDTKTKKTRIAHMPQPVLVALANLPRERQAYTQGDAYLDRPFYLSESRLRIHWDEDVAKAAAAVTDFERLTFHCCRHGFATSMRKGVDPKTAAARGGWDDIGLFMKTYAQAMEDATITDKLFDTPLTRRESPLQQKQEVRKK